MNIQNICTWIIVAVIVSGISIISAQNAKADDIKYQELKRLMPPKRHAYPILESLEKELYPGIDFREEDPSERLERLEIAMLGRKQSGTISERLNKLRSEVANWQIASSSAARPTQLHAEKTPDISTPERYALEAQQRSQMANERLRYSKFLMSERSKARYETNTVRVANPIVQRLGKYSLDAMFGIKKN